MSPTADRLTLTDTARMGWRLCRDLDTRSRRRLGLTGFLTFWLGLLAGLPAVIVGHIVDRVSGADAAFERVLPDLLLLAACIIGTTALRTGAHLVVHSVTVDHAAALRITLAGKVLRAPTHGDQDRSGTVLSRMNRGADGAVRLVRLVFADLLPAVVTAVWALVLAFTQSWVVGAILLVLVPAMLLIVLQQMRSQGGVRVGVEADKALLDGMTAELVAGRETIRTLDAVRSETARLAALLHDVARTERGHHRAMGLFDAAKSGTEQGFAIVVVIAAVVLVTRGAATPGAVLAMFLLHGSITQPLRDLHRIIDEGAESAAQAAFVLGIIDAPDDPAFTARPSEPPPAPVPRLRAAPVLPMVEVTGAKLRFPGRATTALDDVTFSIATGDHVGFAGATASGKTSLLRAILGVINLDEGEIRLQGTDLADLDIAARSRIVGYVPQRPYLVTGSIAHNVTLGLNDPPTADEIEDACRNAAIHEEIAELPDGYDTLIGEGGRGLSGGQQQRLVLARALVRRPEILVLDEATSALDPTSERRVMDALDRQASLTVLAVAHRLSTLRRFDVIHVMEHGRIIQSGTYDTLSAGPGLFSSMLATHEPAAMTVAPASASA